MCGPAVSRKAAGAGSRSRQGGAMESRRRSRIRGQWRECSAWSALLTTTAAERRSAPATEASTAFTWSGASAPPASQTSSWWVATTGVSPASRATSPASSIGRWTLTTREARAIRPASGANPGLMTPRPRRAATGARKTSTPFTVSCAGRWGSWRQATTATRRPRAASPSATVRATSVRPLVYGR